MKEHLTVRSPYLKVFYAVTNEGDDHVKAGGVLTAQIEELLDLLVWNRTNAESGAGTRREVTSHGFKDYKR